ncbi:MAG: hypothetical protein ACK58T_48765, partial [Phycisphaerae bacterium]
LARCHVLAPWNVRAARRRFPPIRLPSSVSVCGCLAPAYRGNVRHYAVWNGFRPNGSPEAGNYTTPYGVAASLAMPTRSFAVPEAGSASSCKSIQYFVHIDASLRANGGAGFGDLDFGPSTRFGFMDGDQG